ncbi:hypothetical protein C8R44DRAFT_367243 [Mycena epipterygia]|nr:hypothetical protein C8R44DRAFT_367243 [Mycena epipterygia]
MMLSFFSERGVGVGGRGAARVGWGVNRWRGACCTMSESRAARMRWVDWGRAVRSGRSSSEGCAGCRTGTGCVSSSGKTRSSGTPSPSVRRSRSIFWRRMVLLEGMAKAGGGEGAVLYVGGRGWSVKLVWGAAGEYAGGGEPVAGGDCGIASSLDGFFTAIRRNGRSALGQDSLTWTDFVELRDFPEYPEESDDTEELRFRLPCEDAEDTAVSDDGYRTRASSSS